jgi:hypothetical protein
MPRPDRAGEAVVNRQLAERLKLRVGSTYRGALIDFPALEEFGLPGRSAARTRPAVAVRSE